MRGLIVKNVAAARVLVLSYWHSNQGGCGVAVIGRNRPVVLPPLALEASIQGEPREEVGERKVNVSLENLKSWVIFDANILTSPLQPLCRATLDVAV